MSVPLLASYGAIRLSMRRRWAWIAVTWAVTTGGLCLVARGWLATPELAAGDLIYPYQLLSAAWDGAHSLPQSVPGPSGWSAAFPISYQLGLTAVGLGILATALYLSKSAHRSEKDQGASCTSSPLPGHIFWFWVAAATGAILPTLHAAGLLWQVTGLGALVQHPWQLLAMAGLPLAFLAGSTVRQEERLAKLPAGAGLVGLVVVAS